MSKLSCNAPEICTVTAQNGITLLSVILSVSYLATYQNRTETEYSREACREREREKEHRAF